MLTTTRLHVRHKFVISVHEMSILTLSSVDFMDSMDPPNNAAVKCLVALYQLRTSDVYLSQGVVDRSIVDIDS